MDPIDKLILIRKEQKISQADLAEYIGISRVSMSNLETKKHSPSMRILFNWVESLGYKLKITLDVWKERFPCDDVHRSVRVIKAEDIWVRSKQDVDRCREMLEKIGPKYYGMTLTEFCNEIDSSNNPINHDPMFGNVNRSNYE